MSVFLGHAGVASEKIHKSQGTQVWVYLNLTVKKKRKKKGNFFLVNLWFGGTPTSYFSHDKSSCVSKLGGGFKGSLKPEPASVTA